MTRRASTSALQVGRAEGSSRGTTSLLRVAVGPHALVFDLRTVLAIENADGRVEHEAIRGPVDLRAWLQVDGLDDPESVLVPGADAVYRLEVCQIGQLTQSALETVHRVPRVLRPLLDRLAVRGLVELPSPGDEEGRGGRLAPVVREHLGARREGARVGFLVDPLRLATAAWCEAR